MSNYTNNQLVADKNNNWNQVFELVKKGETVLDIGCSSGNFGQELIKNKKCVVDGVDIDQKDVALAAKKLRKALVLNVESEPLDALKERYDTILMMDVIEHLVDPVSALQRVAKALKPGGKLIFSVPNMAHISVRLDLLLGDLNYRKTGLLDNTHLHFYTEKTLLDVLNAAGLSVVETHSSTVTYPKQLIDLKLKEAGLQGGEEFRQMITKTKGDIYQFIGTAKVSAKPKALKFPSKNPHEEHYRQVEEAIADQNQHIETLKKELLLKDQHIRNIEARLNHILGSKAYKLIHAPLGVVRKVSSVRQRKDT